MELGRNFLEKINLKDVSDVIILGIDEAGRGCIAGSMFICGTAFISKIKEEDLKRVKDSKKISEKSRFKIYDDFLTKKLCLYDVQKFEPESIDNFGLSYCLKKGFQQVIENVIKQLKKSSNRLLVLIDGNIGCEVSVLEEKFNIKIDIFNVIKGDNKYYEISLASIIAKSRKDMEMIELSKNKEFLDYKFNSNKGYLTKLHIEVIKKIGLSSVHRRSFSIKKIQHKSETSQLKMQFNKETKEILNLEEGKQ